MEGRKEFDVRKSPIVVVVRRTSVIPIALVPACSAAGSYALSFPKIKINPEVRVGVGVGQERSLH